MVLGGLAKYVGENDGCILWRKQITHRPDRYGRQCPYPPFFDRVFIFAKKKASEVRRPFQLITWRYQMNAMLFNLLSAAAGASAQAQEAQAQQSQRSRLRNRGAANVEAAAGGEVAVRREAVEAAAQVQVAAIRLGIGVEVTVGRASASRVNIQVTAARTRSDRQQRTAQDERLQSAIRRGQHAGCAGGGTYQIEP